ncbi:hypothetical protein H5410_035574 [Solanum commersonii]|uniref:Uncharacterized protein n=1 Tax=Solanum commersonii TaxID=4109 RepID=A0A9J5Y5J7_SOLCO|nr:hypothetical protein H5410_035574 [Solanum commersonii]
MVAVKTPQIRLCLSLCQKVKFFIQTGTTQILYSSRDTKKENYAPQKEKNEDRLVPDTDRINTSLRRDSPTNNRTRSPSFGEENYGEHSYY